MFSGQAEPSYVIANRRLRKESTTVAQAIRKLIDDAYAGVSEESRKQIRKRLLYKQSSRSRDLISCSLSPVSIEEAMQTALEREAFLTVFGQHASPGGHSHWKGVWGCAAVMTPFFQASRRSLAHQFTVNAPLLCSLFSIFRKFLHFQPCFGQNSSFLDPKCSKFSFPRLPFFKENPLPRPYILKPAWHTHTKKKLSAPPPGTLDTQN